MLRNVQIRDPSCREQHPQDSAWRWALFSRLPAVPPDGGSAGGTTTDLEGQALQEKTGRQHRVTTYLLPGAGTQRGAASYLLRVGGGVWGRRGSLVHFPALSGREQLQVKKDFLCCVQSALPSLALSHASLRPTARIPLGVWAETGRVAAAPWSSSFVFWGGMFEGQGSRQGPPHPACGGDTQPASARCVSCVSETRALRLLGAYFLIAAGEEHPDLARDRRW